MLFTTCYIFGNIECYIAMCGSLVLLYSLGGIQLYYRQAMQPSLHILYPIPSYKIII